eukprot:3940963-Rhodomonas_salina.4
MALKLTDMVSVLVSFADDRKVRPPRDPHAAKSIAFRQGLVHYVPRMRLISPRKMPTRLVSALSGLMGRFWTQKMEEEVSALGMRHVKVTCTASGT